MHVESPFSGPELTLAWWSTTHQLHGSYYRRYTMRPQDCTVVDVTEPFAGSGDASKEGEIHVTLSDGSVFRSAGPLQGGGVVRLGLTPLDNPIEDVVGPIVDDHVRVLYAKLGITLPQVENPAEDQADSTSSTSNEVGKQEGAAPATGDAEQTSNVVPIPAGDHEHVGHLLSTLYAFLDREAHAALNEARKLLGFK